MKNKVEITIKIGSTEVNYDEAEEIYMELKKIFGKTPSLPDLTYPTTTGPWSTDPLKNDKFIGDLWPLKATF